MRLPHRHAVIVAALVAISCVATLVVAIAGSALVNRARYRDVTAPVYGSDVPHVPIVVVPVPGRTEAPAPGPTVAPLPLTGAGPVLVSMGRTPEAGTGATFPIWPMPPGQPLPSPPCPPVVVSPPGQPGPGQPTPTPTPTDRRRRRRRARPDHRRRRPRVARRRARPPRRRQHRPRPNHRALPIHRARRDAEPDGDAEPHRDAEPDGRSSADVAALFRVANRDAGAGLWDRLNAAQRVPVARSVTDRPAASSGSRALLPGFNRPRPETCRRPCARSRGTATARGCPAGSTSRRCL